MLRVILTDAFQERMYEANILYSNTSPQDIHNVSFGKPTYSKILVNTVIEGNCRKSSMKRSTSTDCSGNTSST
jgi:hypothetical protein